MIYFIPTVGYVRQGTPFHIELDKFNPDTGEPEKQMVVMPKNALPGVAEELGAVPQPEVPEGKKLTPTDQGWVLEDLSAEELKAVADSKVAALIGAAWSEANAAALAAADQNSRGKYLDWKYDPETPEDIRTRAVAVIKWLDGLWGKYTAYRAAVESGDLNAVMEDFGECPHDFAQVAGLNA